MASRGKDKKEMDPEEMMSRKFRAKCLLRALGRLVMDNAYWLIEGIDQYEGVDDVKRRVEQAVRGKAKKKQLLNINDKALLNKSADERTDHEKKYLFRIIGGLKCFKRYPNHVKKKLAAVTYFKYYGPGRVIVRQHHEAHALYFIITGDVVVSQSVYDELIEKYVSVDIGVMHPGDLFGEVSLLHNIPRTATVTTSDHCEFLQLMKEDFKNVLQASVQKQWDEVLLAMSAFTYFDALDEVARREGCIVAKMKTYDVDETLLGDGVGIANFVYFILSGRCQMIESLQVTVTTHMGRSYYSLYDPFVPKEESEEDFDTKYFGAYKLNQESRASAIASSSIVEKEQKPSSVTVTHETSRPGMSGSASLPSALRKRSTIEGTSKHGSVNIIDSKNAGLPGLPRKSITSTGSRRASRPGHKRRSGSSGSQQETQFLLPISEHTNRASQRFSTTPEDTPFPPTNLRTYFMQKPDGSLAHSATEKANLFASLFASNLRLDTGAKQPPIILNCDSSMPEITTHTKEVCQLNPGSSFGFGENMRDRRIVALTPVACMLMPKIWLLQRNTANIWTRIQHYLEKKIPTKKQLFKEFVSQRRWVDFRDQLVDDVVERSNTVNYTSVHDVPYSIRMNEMLDI